MRVAIYARVSTGEQSTDVQTSELRRWLEAQGHEVVAEYVEVMSGAKKARPQLEALLGASDSDVFDAVAVVKLDRLARSTQHLIELAGELEASGIDLMVKDQAIDTSTPAGRLMFHVLAAIAEFERDLIRERTRAGLAYAKSQGVAIGRPRRELPLETARWMRGRGFSDTEIARKLELPRTTLRAALLREA